MTHLQALQNRLYNERIRFNCAQGPKEREIRAVRCAQIEREIADELKFLGKTADVLPEMTDNELLNELKG